MDEPIPGTWAATMRKAAPWLVLILLLYASQLLAVFDSEFSMPLTLLQLPFVLAFMGFVVAIAYHRLKEDQG